jgi:hypothetical protein
MGNKLSQVQLGDDLISILYRRCCRMKSTPPGYSDDRRVLIVSLWRPVTSLHNVVRNKSTMVHGAIVACAS